MDSLPSVLPTALRELIRYVRPPWLRRWVRDGYGWLQPRLSPVARAALPPHLSAEYLEQTRGAIDFNRPGIPIVASLPSVHIADTYGKAHHGRPGTVAAITEWAARPRRSPGRPQSRCRRTGYERSWQSRRHPLELRSAPGGRRTDAQGAGRGRGRPRNRAASAMPVVVVTDASARLAGRSAGQVGDTRGPAAHSARRCRPARRRGRDSRRRLQAPRHHRGGHAGRAGRRLPAGVGRQRRRRRGGSAHFVGAVGYLRRRRADGGRARPRSAGCRLEVGGDGHRFCRAGCRSGRGRRRRPGYRRGRGELRR